MNLKGKSFLKLLDLTNEEMAGLLDLAADLKAKKKAGIPHKLHEGKNIVLLFEKDSTRTRCAFEVAGHDLGRGVTYLGPTGSQMGKKESIADTARVLGRMYDGIGICYPNAPDAPHTSYELTAEEINTPEACDFWRKKKNNEL